MGWLLGFGGRDRSCRQGRGGVEWVGRMGWVEGVGWDWIGGWGGVSRARQGREGLG